MLKKKKKKKEILSQTLLGMLCDMNYMNNISFLNSEKIRFLYTCGLKSFRSEIVNL